MKEKNEIKKAINLYFDYLFENNFDIVEFRKPESFGNWIVYLESPDFHVRINEDRGNVFIYLFPSWIKESRKNKYLIDLESLIAFFNNNVGYKIFENIPFSYEEQLKTLSNVLKMNYIDIASFFDKSNYTRKEESFKDFAKKRIKHFLNSI